MSFEVIVCLQLNLKKVEAIHRTNSASCNFRAEDLLEHKIPEEGSREYDMVKFQNYPIRFNKIRKESKDF